LSDAFQRVAATGINEEHAREDICKAIADRRIKIRGLVGKETVSSTPVMGTPRWHSAKAFAGGHVAGTVRNGSEVEIPWNLQPLDLNWQQSRPLKRGRISDVTVFGVGNSTGLSCSGTM